MKTPAQIVKSEYTIRIRTMMDGTVKLAPTKNWPHAIIALKIYLASIAGKLS